MVYPGVANIAWFIILGFAGGGLRVATFLANNFLGSAKNIHSAEVSFTLLQGFVEGATASAIFCPILCGLDSSSTGDGHLQ